MEQLPPQAEKRLIDAHHAQMRALQQSKEMERKRIVKDERRRRRHALTAASASSSTSSLSLALVPQWNPNQGQPRRTDKLRNTEWLNAYENVPTDFEVSMPGGFEFDEEPAAGSYHQHHQHHQPSPPSSSPYQYGLPHQQQNQFASLYAALPLRQLLLSTRLLPLSRNGLLPVARRTILSLSEPTEPTHRSPQLIRDLLSIEEIANSRTPSEPALTVTRVHVVVME